MMTSKQIKLARENWIEASERLGFKLITPYSIEINGHNKEVFAFLPEYGSPNGAIICLTYSPEFIIDTEIINWAQENNYFYSFVNIDSCQNYDENYFKEILEDWRN